MKINLVVLLSFFFLLSIKNEAFGITLNKKDSLGSETSYFRRIIPSNKHILTIMASNNQYPLILTEKSPIISQRFYKGFNRHNIVDAIYINYQYALNKSIFFESGFKYLTYMQGVKAYFDVINDYTKSWMSFYSSYSSDFGAGYRIIVDKNLRLFDLHTGISIGFIDNPIGVSASNGFIDAFQNEKNEWVTFEATYKGEIINRVTFGLYLGVSKDIRITKNLYFSGRYHYYFGRWSKSSEHQIEYNFSNPFMHNKHKAYLTAEGQMINIGLRWVFD